jgi:hypothetical protein
LKKGLVASLPAALMKKIRCFAASLHAALIEKRIDCLRL